MKINIELDGKEIAEICKQHLFRIGYEVTEHSLVVDTDKGIIYQADAQERQGDGRG